MGTGGQHRQPKKTRLARAEDRKQDRARDKSSAGARWGRPRRSGQLYSAGTTRGGTRPERREKISLLAGWQRPTWPPTARAARRAPRRMHASGPRRVYIALPRGSAPEPASSGLSGRPPRPPMCTTVAVRASLLLHPAPVPGLHSTTCPGVASLFAAPPPRPHRYERTVSRLPRVRPAPGPSEHRAACPTPGHAHLWHPQCSRARRLLTSSVTRRLRATCVTMLPRRVVLFRRLQLTDGRMVGATSGRPAQRPQFTRAAPTCWRYS